MIGITKILTGKATVSAAVRAGGAKHPHLLQFSSHNRPVVVWNVTDRCNLECEHCYLESSPGASGGTLSTGEARDLIDDLAAMRVPVLLFSGGEPLLREDIFELGAYAAERGLRPGLSTNGTLINPEVAGRLKGAGFAYAGISLDGAEATHDRFRNHTGAFAKAVEGLRNAAAAGMRTGVRFTLNRHNAAELANVLDLVERERIGRFCMYHLVYAGRGAGMRDDDVTLAQSRAAVESLIEKALDWSQRGIDTEILTTDNHADGVLVLKYVEEHMPSRADEVRSLLGMAGGCSAGKKFACIGSLGDVYPCQFWRHEKVGNIRERKFSAIWQDASDLACSLRSMARSITGQRCSSCKYLEVCGGCRIRALAAGDVWGDDPHCYLSDSEVAGG